MSAVRGLLRIATTTPLTSDVGPWTSDRRRTPAWSDGGSARDLAGVAMPVTPPVSARVESHPGGDPTRPSWAAFGCLRR